MRLKDKVINISRWDYYSLVILILAVVFQLLKWIVLPIFLDVYYHLLTAVGFNEAGGWVSSCFWEYAPVGRPQVYPPLLHIIMLFFLKLGISILVVGKLTQFAIYPLLLFTIWYVVRKLFDKRLAFFSLFMFFSIYSFYLITINTLAASLSLIFCLFALFFLEKNNIFTSSILFALAFYTHGFTPWLFLIAFLLYGLFNRERLKSCLKICLFALFLASPLITYQISMRQYYTFQKDLAENLYREFSIFHWVIFLLGLFVCFKKKANHYIFVSLFLAFIFLLFVGMFFRYLSFYGIMSLIFMNAVFLSNLFEKIINKYKKLYLSSIFILFFILSPTLTIDLLEKDNSKVIFDSVRRPEIIFSYKKEIFNFRFIDSSLLNFIFYCSGDIRYNEVTIYFPRLFSEVVDVILKNTNENDIIYTNMPYPSGILSLLSYRATSNAMLSEIKPYRDFDQIAYSKLIIWFKNPDDMNKEPNRFIKIYNLNKIADTESAFIYENPKSNFKKQSLSATISYKILFILMFLVFILIVWGAKFGIDKRQKNVIL